MDPHKLTALAVARTSFDKEFLPGISKEERLQVLAAELFLELKGERCKSTTTFEVGGKVMIVEVKDK